MGKVTDIKKAMDKKKKADGCKICCEVHPKSGKCNRKHLIFRIENLIRANALVPGLAGSNKTAVSVAMELEKQVRGLQGMAKLFDESHTMLMEILKNHGEIGEQIKNQYLEKIDTWAKARISPDTSGEQGELFNQENSTQPETEISDSTKQPSGLAFVEGSSNTTRSAMLAAREQPSVITLNPAKDE